MSKQIPYLYRRGDVYSYRIAVPLELREIVGCREVTQSLHTSDRLIAQPLALELAAISKRLFIELRLLMAKQSDNLAIENAKLKHEIQMLRVRREIEKKEAIAEAESQVDYALTKLKSELFDSERAKQNTTNNLSHSNLTEPTRTSPKLSKVIEKFLKIYLKDKHPEMFKKHMTVLPVFLESVGDKFVHELKQQDINNFFDLIQSLPPRWADECRKKKISIKDLAKIEHPKTLGPKTFESTYIAAIRSFLSTAITDWQDEGFPVTLTTAKIVYRGDRVEGENKQRPFKPEELKALFCSKEMQSYVADDKTEHNYWLPFIALYTGARVNEICQINPQTDIVQDDISGIWYLDINETEDADERIIKRTKNKVSRRKVPIHSELLKNGFIDYFDRIKKSGSKLIFPKFKPSKGKASASGERWFRQFLIDLNLRDDTAFAKITGMHAFRSTFSNAAMNVGIDESSLVGHAGLSTAVARGYRGELSLKNKLELIETIKFDLN